VLVICSCCHVPCLAVPCRALLLQAASFRLSHEKVFTPLVTLAMLIQQNPEVAAIKKSFPKVAQQLMASVSEELGPRAVLCCAVLCCALIAQAWLVRAILCQPVVACKQ